jgi:hypothetical protein
MIRSSFAILPLALLAASPAAALQSVDQQLEGIGRLFEAGNRAGLQGNHHVEIVNYRRALDELAAVEEKLDAPRRDVTGGRREIQLSLGEAYVNDRKPSDALDVYRLLADELSPDGAIPEDRTERLHLARALRGMVDAGVRSQRYPEARAALPRLVAVGRAMHTAEPRNTYLTRRLAQDLQNETLFRWLLEEGGSADLARETLALFRSVAEASPGNVEAMRSHFLWAFGAAELNRNDMDLWREALAVGEQLERRRQMRPEHEIFMRAVRARVPRS